MEDSLTLLTLAGGLEVEWIDRPLILAHLADESTATAHEAHHHMLGAESQASLQCCHQLASVQLLHVLDAVGVRGCVEILPWPDHFSQRNFDPLSLGSGAGSEIGHKVDQLLPQPAGLFQHRGNL